mgnify:CR=1 FL=1
MATYLFLSDDWFDAVHEILTGQATPGNAGATSNVVMNLTVTETPFEETRELHVGSKDGVPLWGRAHDTQADLSITVDYVTAKLVFVSGDGQAALAAFMAGKVTVQGDLTKLMTLVQDGESGLRAAGIAESLQAITD